MRRAGSTPSRKASLYITDAEDGIYTHAPLTLGIINYFERHLPFVGFFQSVGLPLAWHHFGIIGGTEWPRCAECIVECTHLRMFERLARSWRSPDIRPAP